MELSHLNNTQRRGLQGMAVGGAVLATATVMSWVGIFGDIYGHEHPNPPNGTQLNSYAHNATQAGLSISNAFEVAGALGLMLGWSGVGFGLYTIWQGMREGENINLLNNSL